MVVGVISGNPVVNEDGTVTVSGVTMSSSVFEKQFFNLVKDDNKITEEDVCNLVEFSNVHKTGETTAVITAKIVTGFEIVTTSSCVNPEDYDNDLGHKYGLKKVWPALYDFLGFIVQWGKEGVSR